MGYSQATEAQDLAILYYTVAGIVLYLAADAILNRIEARRGQRFEHRSLIFFFILLALALVAFQLIQHFLLTPPPQ
jgi:zinc transporter ZupT